MVLSKEHDSQLYIYIPSSYLAVGTEEVFMGYRFLLAKDN